MAMLNIGKIDYLNVWPLFHLLEQEQCDNYRLTPGHPSFLNACLAKGSIDISPSSAFEYFLHAERYQILPELSISSDGPVQSVLLASPVPMEELPDFLTAHGNRVNVTGASATSVGLFKILWSLAWKFPAPEWHVTEPALGLSQGLPFLEIGDRALDLYVNRPQGWQIIDLGEAWKQWTGLPFVFALWIVRNDLDDQQYTLLHNLSSQLVAIKKSVHARLDRLAAEAVHTHFTPAELIAYWNVMSYELGHKEQASLALYAHYCTQLNLLPGCPALHWFK
ncbi:MAG: menaquinone biosynthesis protein [Desulfoplanes sp.]|nr:menaquinone biosynthesis protein [Desulfoplanes sp.]